MRLVRLFLLCVSILLISGPVRAADNDGDGLEDEWELSYFATLAEENASGDPDGDGLSNGEEEKAGTNPTEWDTDNDGLGDAQEVGGKPPTDPANMDSDGDFLSDGMEVLELGTDPGNPDTDWDGLTDFIEHKKGFNPLDADTDGGGIWDGTEVLFDNTDPLEPSDDQLDSDGDLLTNYQELMLGTNPFAPDTDNDWLEDGKEDANHNGQVDEGETDPLLADTDGDGLEDGWEVLVYHSDPFVEDTDGDGLLDGEEHAVKLAGADCLSPSRVDSDFDGLDDGEEVAAGGELDPCLADSDGDGLLDISEVYDGTSAMDPGDHAADGDNDGLSDVFEMEVTGTKMNDSDTDGDLLSDAEEFLLLADRFQTDPLDADTDDDGLLDGKEGGKLGEEKLSFGTSPVDADSDGDGLTDGLERGLTAPQKSAKGLDATDPGVFQADTDPSSVTSPTEKDTDEDTLSDGQEDANANGRVDATETDPTLYDTDGDGMDDGWEVKYSTVEGCPDAVLGPLDPLNPTDKSKDNDGDELTNLKEYQLTKLEKGKVVKNQTNPCMVDTDQDGLSDSQEVYGTYGPGGMLGKGTDPNNPDTDGDGLLDGIEDLNHDGKWEPLTETSPIQKDTDGDNLPDGFEVTTVKTNPKEKDTDGDGLSDGDEYNLLGTDPLNPDFDGDGLSDGLEVGVLSKDSCPQTKTNPHKSDTDGDSLPDGIEDANHDGCWNKTLEETDPLDADSDNDKLPDGVEVGGPTDKDPDTTTDPLLKDSDQDGLWDSHEDKNKNGKVDKGETDPNVKDTDSGGVADGTEVLVDGTDPLNPLDDNTADPDGDGLTNGEEKAIGTDPFNADSDFDTIPDGVEVGENHIQPPDSDQDGLIDAVDPDSDGDTVPDSVEAGDSDPATAPFDSDGDLAPDYLDFDSDEDTIPDLTEWNVDANGDGTPDVDADSDGIPNYLDLDSDDAQGPDKEEGTGDSDGDSIPNFVDPLNDPVVKLDSDGDGLNDLEEDDIGTDPHNPDTDSDGLTDKQEVDAGTDPLDADCDDDGLPDGDDGLEDTDDDGLICAFDPDSDDDGVFDGTERGKTKPIPDSQYVGKNGQTYIILGTDESEKAFEPDLSPVTLTDHTTADTDGDGASDGAEDPNHNGKVEPGELDPLDPNNGGLTPEVVAEILADDDSDGLTNLQEWGVGIMGTDGDLDDDGVLDGQEHNWRHDTDRDRLANLLDPDSDNDGLADGTEQGLEEPARPEATDLRMRNFHPDLDPGSTTRALIADTDRDDLRDGLEDPNHNGRVDSGESDPNDASDTRKINDADGDGLDDAEEVVALLSPDDSDSDDDGVPDGAEANAFYEVDWDGLACALDPDSDNDGLADGTEVGLIAPVKEGPNATDRSRGNFIADEDPTSVTCPMLRDTDRGGLSDGSEDTDKNGRVDVEEGDPLDASDDFAHCQDTDADNLCDAEETWGNISPFDADSDDDGLPDGDEHNWNFDTDRDNVVNVFDPDSDNDVLPDGLELGVTEPVATSTAEFDGEQIPVAGTDLEAGFFKADLDPTTLTFMLVADSDRGGVEDGKEDANANGRVDLLETDPCDPSDDGMVTDDMDGDGLSNELELSIGTDPLNKDSDGDTIPDNVEVGPNPEIPLDSDGDGRIDALDEDSDADGIPDAEEAGDDNLVTAPVDSDGDGTPNYLDLDSDDDGLSDEDEHAFYLTNPTDQDTDGGGAGDYLEVMVHKSDPNDPADDFKGWFEDGARVRGGGGCGVAYNPPAQGAWWFWAIALAVLIRLVEAVKSRFREHYCNMRVRTVILGLGCPRRGLLLTLRVLSIASSTLALNTRFTLERRDKPLRARFKERSPPLGPSTAGQALTKGPLLFPVKPGRYGRVGRVVVTALIGLAGLVAPLEQARAQYVPDPVYHPDAYSTAIQGNLFQMAPDGEGVFSVATDEVLGHLGVRGAAFVHFMDSPVVLARGEERVRTLIGYRLETHLCAALGVLDRYEIGVLAPAVLYQDAQYPGMKLGGVSSRGLGNTSFFGKVRLLSSDKFPFGVALILPAYAPTGDSKAYMGYDSWGFAPALSLARRIDDFVIAATFSVVIQPDESLNNVKDTNKLGGGLGLVWARGAGPLEVGVELTGFVRADRPFEQAEEVQAELDAGVKYRIGGYRLVAGVGKGVSPGFMTPNYRFFAGLEYAWKPNPDRDGDGIPNLHDSCPDRAEDVDGFEDDDGCPDPDNDGDQLLDKVDRCPNEAEDMDGFEDDDGCPDPDNDKDGIPDKSDQCPNNPEDHDKFQDDDGCPDPDNDGDGIPDTMDKCPNEKEVFNEYQDEDGCPDKKLAEIQKEGRRIQILQKIHFKFMSAQIEPESYEILDQIVQILKDNPQVRFVQVEGHTDKTGSYEFNMALSRERAQAVVDYLVSKGIDPARLSAVGYGYTRQIDYRSGPEANYNNRRVEFNILKYDE